MKEIITVQVGQCGNQIGWRFWDCVNAEHENYGDTAAAATFFARGRAGQGRRARAVLVDMEEGVVSQLLRSSLSHLFHESLSITDVSGCGNNWSVGYRHYGPQYGPMVMESVRRLLEPCDSPQSVQLIHSVGGGTGSGLGSWILEHLSMEFPELYRLCTSVLPAAVDDVVTSPYNAVLSLAQLREHADCVFAVENDALAEHPIVKEYQAARRPRAVATVPAKPVDQVQSVPAHRPSPVLHALQQADDVLAKAQGMLGAADKRTKASVTSGASRATAGGQADGRKSVGQAAHTRTLSSGKLQMKVSTTLAGQTAARGVPASRQSIRPAPEAAAPAAAPPRPLEVKAEPRRDEQQAATPTAVATPRPKGSAFDGMNEVVARMLADMSASVRFPGSMNVDLNELASTLVPFPRLQFLTTGLSMCPTGAGPARDDMVEGLVAGTFARRAALITADLARERHVALACILRGTDSIASFTDTLAGLRRDLRFVPWNAYGFKSGLCSVPPPWAKATALTISNNVCVRTPLARSYDRFLKLYRARAHLHHYLEYLEPGEVVQAAHAVVGSVEAYEDLAAQGASADIGRKGRYKR